MTQACFADALGMALAERACGPLFGLTGSGNIQLAAAFQAAGGRFVTVRHEGAAVAMASGWAQASGQVGLVSLHQGPGLTNALTAIVDAAKDRVPLVIVTAIAASPQARQYVDQVAVLDALGVGVRSVLVHETDPVVVLEAMRQAAAESCCVVLHVSTDLLDLPAELGKRVEASRPLSDASTTAEAGGLSDSDLALLTDRLASAARPTLIAGRGAVLASAESALCALAEATGATLVTTAGGRGMFSGHGAHRGMIGGLGSAEALDAMREADLVVGFGTSWDAWSTCHGVLTSHAEVLGVDLRAHDEVTTVLADAGRAAGQLVEALARTSRESVTTHTDGEAVSVPHPGHAVSTWPQRPGHIHPAQLCTELDRLLPSDRTVVFDSGHFMAFVARFVEAHRPGGYLFGQGFQSIGLGLARGVGAALARRGSDGATVAFCGDGGLLMGLPELDTLARSGAPLLVVCFNDAAFGAEVHDFEPRGVDVSVARFPAVDLAATARALGVDAQVIRAADELRIAVAQWLDRTARGPLLLDCRVDPLISATSVLTELGAREWSGH